MRNALHIPARLPLSPLQDAITVSSSTVQATPPTFLVVDTTRHTYLLHKLREQHLVVAQSTSTLNPIYINTYTLRAAFAMTTWLSKQRKADLVDLAEEAGYIGCVRPTTCVFHALGAHQTRNSVQQACSRTTSSTASRRTCAAIRADSRATPPLVNSTHARRAHRSRRSAPALRSRLTLPTSTEGRPNRAGAIRRPPRISCKSLPYLSHTPQHHDQQIRTDRNHRRTPTVTDLAATIKSAASHTQAVAEQAIDRITEQLPDVNQYMERMPLPASPAAVTDLVERQTERLAVTVNSYWDRWQMTPHLHSARTALSTSAAVSLIAVLVEAFGLSRVILLWRYAFSTPAVSAYGPLALHLPDFFVLLTAGFWAPITLWAMTSLLVPLTFGWFFNFTSAKTVARSRGRAARVDPFAYCVAKALLVWLVFERGFRYGGAFSKTTVYIVGGSMPGGHTTAFVGAAIGMLASLYEAVLRRP